MFMIWWAKEFVVVDSVARIPDNPKDMPTVVSTQPKSDEKEID
jgi:hypothetical protein